MSKDSDENKGVVIKKRDGWVYSPESYKLPPIDNVLPMPKVQPPKEEPERKK